MYCLHLALNHFSTVPNSLKAAARSMVGFNFFIINPFSDDEEIKSYLLDLTTASKLLEAAVEKGDLGTGEAEYILFQLHYIGRGTYQNTTIAKQWLEKSKAKHWPEAQTPEDAVQSMENKFADFLKMKKKEWIFGLRFGKHKGDNRYGVTQRSCHLFQRQGQEKRSCGW